MKESLYHEVPDNIIPDQLSIVHEKKGVACPFAAPIVTPPKFAGGNQQIMFRSCGTWCALLVEKSRGITTVTYLQRCCGAVLEVQPVKKSEDAAGGVLNIEPK